MATHSSNWTNELIITAMDRFVWFVLLVVMSHLVTEFTRVTGYARGPKNDVVMLNDTLLQPIHVQNLVLYPAQDFALYENAYYAGNGHGNSYGNNDNNYNTNNYNTNNNNKNKNTMQQTSAPVVSATGNNNANTGQGFSFSFRPLIDSIFEIPISTLRAVNNLVSRLTGSYQQQPPAMVVEKSASDVESVETDEVMLLPPVRIHTASESRAPAKVIIRAPMLREENA